MNQNQPNVLVLNIEGLRAEFLGPYGNDWIDTPHFNRLAVEGFVFDHCLVGGVNSCDQLTALWSGCHPSQALPTRFAIDAGKAQWLVEVFRRAGYFTILTSSSESVTKHPGASAFDEHRLVAPVKEAAPATSNEHLPVITDPEQLAPVGEPAADWSETRTAAVFSELIQIIETQESPQFIWCQLTTLRTVWESPLELRERFREPGDPPVWPGTNIPRAFFGPGTDPDVYLPFVQAYAAEVYILDLCLGGLLEVLKRNGDKRPWVVVLLSSRGLPLGEHGHVGFAATCFYNELLHVPLIFSFPNGAGQAERSQALVYPHDIMPTLATACGLVDKSDTSLESLPPAGTCETVWIAGRNLLPVIEGSCDFVRDRLFSYSGADVLAIRTPAWLAQILLSEDGDGPGDLHEQVPERQIPFVDHLKAIVDADDDSEAQNAEDAPQEELLSRVEIAELRKHVRLFVKPDDRWEINEVADRCPDVAVEFLKMASRFLKVCTPDGDKPEPVDFLTLPPLNEVLAKGIGAP